MPKNKFKKKPGSSLVERKRALREAAQEAKQDENRSKLKGKQNYSVDQLLDKAEDCIDRFEFEMAQKFCQRALELEPDHIRALETVGTLLLEVGNTDGAKQCFGRAVEVSPEEGHTKYMYLGQLMEGAMAVQCFQKGIELMVKEKGEREAKEVAAACRGADEAPITDRDISNAFCSIAEIYMTDSCFDEDAENKCKENVEKAIETDGENPEAYQLRASFMLSKDKKDEAREDIKKSVSLWLPKVQAMDKGDVPDEEFDPVETVSLTFDARVASGKILIEVEEFELACEVLESLLDEDDEVPPVWYMLGWANYLQGQDFRENARYYLNKANKVYAKVKYEDADLLKHITDLLEEIGPGKGDDDDDAQNGDKDIEPDSTDDEGEAMEH
ncbi:probable assembly chaperone of rpl4 isoform X1 [Haliotis rubra]|uniref:probable assembly chaperone of rpl4 isoform X1 n=2 Tax=Haliotis rubra TaxID=36100 RepID=UPI001EE55139|nr:probable assembly chaperone of rpl4 isoform X1 [Haliotis rubra]